MVQDTFREFRFNKRERFWIGKLQPTFQSPQYSVKVMYQLFGAPKVEVTDPPLHPNPKHTYPDGSLCLYFPSEHAWRGINLPVPTILLWTSEWLYCYEIWLASGEWIGKEAPHNESKALT